MKYRFYKYIELLVFLSLFYLLIFESPFNIDNYIINKLNVNVKDLLKFKIIGFVSLFVVFSLLDKKVSNLLYKLERMYENNKEKLYYKSKLYFSCWVYLLISVPTVILIIIFNIHRIIRFNTFFSIVFGSLFVLYLTITVVFVLCSFLNKKKKINLVTEKIIIPAIDTFLKLKRKYNCAIYSKFSKDDRNKMLNILYDGMKYINNDENLILFIIGFENLFVGYNDNDFNMEDNIIDSAFIDLIEQIDKRNKYIFGNNRVYLS